MAWFRCFIRGENFPGELIHESQLVGFYLTRFIEAGTPEEAESRALEALRSEPKIAPPPGYTPSGIARVYFEEIEEVPASLAPAQQPGFAWFPMTGSQDSPEPSVRRVEASHGLSPHENLANQLAEVLAGRLSLSLVLEQMRCSDDRLALIASNLHHYAADADIRSRDRDYRLLQEAELLKLIGLLLEGRVREAGEVSFLARTH